ESLAEHAHRVRDRVRQLVLAARGRADAAARGEDRRREAPQRHADERVVAEPPQLVRPGLLHDLREATVRVRADKRVRRDPLRRDAAGDERVPAEPRERAASPVEQRGDRAGWVDVVRVDDEELVVADERLGGEQRVCGAARLVLRREREADAAGAQCRVARADRVVVTRYDDARLAAPGICERAEQGVRVRVAVEGDKRLEPAVSQAALRVVERHAGRGPAHARAAARGEDDGARGCGTPVRHLAGMPHLSPSSCTPTRCISCASGTTVTRPRDARPRSRAQLLTSSRRGVAGTASHPVGPATAKIRCVVTSRLLTRSVTLRSIRLRPGSISPRSRLNHSGVRADSTSGTVRSQVSAVRPGDRNTFPRARMARATTPRPAASTIPSSNLKRAAPSEPAARSYNSRYTETCSPGSKQRSAAGTIVKSRLSLGSASPFGATERATSRSDIERSPGGNTVASNLPRCRARRRSSSLIASTL